jgi:cob(I)alamin adenosyltransferase
MSNDTIQPGAFIRASTCAAAWLADLSTDFQSNDQIYEGGRALFQLGETLSSCANREEYQQAEAQLTTIRTRLHERLQNINPHTTFTHACHSNNLTPLPKLMVEGSIVSPAPSPKA